AVVHDDGVRRCPELIVGELLREAELRLALTDPACGKPLDHGRARSHDDPDAVARLAEVTVEQLDRLHDEDRVVGKHRACFEHASDHPRMEDLLEAAELRRVPEDLSGELRSVDLLVLAEHFRPERLHDRAVAHRSAYLLVVHDRVSVEHLRAELAQHRRYRRFPRAYRPSEPHNERRHSLFSLSFAHSSYRVRRSRSRDAYSSPTLRVSM